MGADFRTFSVRRASGPEVRELVVSWLGAKGFEPCDETSLFPFDVETERGVVLSETPDWTTIAFSHGFEEGDRLVFELKKLNKPLLEVWVFDSDVWGYRLHESGKLVASFNSTPRYFGGPPDLELPRNGDPELLCEMCDLSVEPRKIASIQRKWAVFKEGVAERFCDEIGAEAAVCDYRDFDEVRLEAGQYTTADGTRIERMFFVRGGKSRQSFAPSLHEIVFRVPRAPQMDPQLAAWQAEMQAQLAPLMILMRVVGWGFGLIFWLLRPLVYLWLWRKIVRHKNQGGFLRKLEALQDRPEVERRGARLVNRRHGCSIEVPKSTEMMPFVGLHAVFSFRISGVLVDCGALRPSHLREQSKLWPGAEILKDEKYFVGELPARTVELKHPLQDDERQIIWHLVETPQAVYRFQLSGEELSEKVREEFRAVLESFWVGERA
jgi:hypothetical protein